MEPDATTEVTVTVEAPTLPPTPTPTPTPEPEVAATETATIASLAEAVGRIGAQVQALQTALTETQAQATDARNLADSALSGMSSIQSTLAEAVKEVDDDGDVEELPVVIPEVATEAPAKTRGAFWRMIFG